jgi:hypothetical protein
MIQDIFSLLDRIHRINRIPSIEMNFPAASHGVSMKDKFNPNASSCGELNPADFAISTSHSL